VRAAAEIALQSDGRRALRTDEGLRARRRVLVLKYFHADQSEPGASVLPYGLDWLSEAGVDLRWPDAGRRSLWNQPRFRAAVRWLERLTAPFLETLLATREIARVDSVLAIFESQGNALAALRSMRIRPYTRPRLVVVSCWLAMEAQRAGRTRRAMYRFMYRGVDRLVYFSTNQTEIYRTVLGIPDERLAFVPYGVDPRVFAPMDLPEDGSVLAVGRDRGRDWATLFDAVRGTDLRVRVASRPEDLAGFDVPPNVEPFGFVDLATYRDLTGRASVIVVPTKVREYPTGQSVTLEAMSMGKCCVVTDTPAMRDYLDGENALLVPPGNPLALRSVLEHAVADPNLRKKIGNTAREAVLTRFNAEKMWRSVAALL
jgi:glycosyltransferase involved in cell wall biosynthesis